MNRSMQAEIEELESLSVPELVERYTELWGQPPRTKNRRHLWKRCAWKLQENRFGGLSKKAKERLEVLIAELDLPLELKGRVRLNRVNRNGLTPGTTLIRSWHGTEIRVEVQDNGFEWTGELYRSLSAVARAITGTRWNGPLFFGLRKTKS